MGESEENVGEARDECDVETFGPGHLSYHLETEDHIFR